MKGRREKVLATCQVSPTEMLTRTKPSRPRPRPRN